MPHKKASKNSKKVHSILRERFRKHTHNEQSEMEKRI